jgi:hypothetical protein
MTDLVTQDQPNDTRSVSLLDYRPKAMVEAATEIANVLKDVIDKQQLFKELNGNKHVKAEGWATLGTMLSILPKERHVTRHEDGSYEAYVDLVNSKTGLVVGGGSGYVGMDEHNWAKKPSYARRSMAITRGTSKAYKTCFSWIIALAGYNSTPAEEMEGIVVEKAPVKEKAEAPKKLVAYDGSADQKKELAKLFTAKKITDKDERTKINNALINWRVPCDAFHLEEGVDTALQQLKQDGKISEIPF